MGMDAFIKKLRQYIADNPIRFEDESDTAILDALFWYYAECHGMNNEKTREMDAELYNSLSKLPLQDNDKVFHLIVDLCAEHEHIAFITGLRLGAQLVLELR